jgi:hypothetical protein
MAVYKSIFTPRGRVGDLQFYESDGKKLIRENSSITRERILNAPEFRRTRENMQEFGGAAAAGKALRKSFAKVMGSFKDRSITARTLQVLRSIIGKDAGVRGQRALSISTYRHMLVGFQFDKRTPFGSVFQGDYSVVVPASRDSATITFPDFSPDAVVRAPAGASHFRIVMAIGVLSDHVFDGSSSSYAALEPDLALLNANTTSAIFPLGAPFIPSFSLSAALTPAPTMSGIVSLAVVIGVEFFDNIGADYYVLAAGNGMMIDSLH